MLRFLLILPMVCGAAHAQRTLGPNAPAAAEARYQVGLRAYGEGRFDDAARSFQVALRLSPGQHVVTVVLDGYEDAARTIDTSGPRTVVTIDLTKVEPPAPWYRWAGAGVAVLGAGALTAGAVFHLQASDDAAEATGWGRASSSGTRRSRTTSTAATGSRPSATQWAAPCCSPAP